MVQKRRHVGILKGKMEKLSLQPHFWKQSGVIHGKLLYLQSSMVVSGKHMQTQGRNLIDFVQYISKIILKHILTAPPELLLVHHKGYRRGPN